MSAGAARGSDKSDTSDRSDRSDDREGSIYAAGSALLAASMLWASAISREADVAAAVAAVVPRLRAQLRGGQADLVFLFVSPHHAGQYEVLPRLLAAELPGAVLVGCSGGGIIGDGSEAEEEPALAVSAALLPGVGIHPFACESAQLPVEAAEWRRLLGVPAVDTLHWIVLPDPFSFDSESFVRGLDAAFPSGTKCGGLASGAAQPGGNALFLGAQTRRSGAVGVALSGALEVDSIVAQGCRPIGEPMFVTACERNIVHHLDGEPALEKLQDLLARLPPSDQALARHSLFFGIVMRGDRQQYRQGDFLVRNLVGADPESGALAVGALLQRGAVVQFHLRDAQTSADDLAQMLDQYEEGGRTPRGALLFSCLGRGRHLYGETDHDSAALRRRFAAVPLGGFFCNGEIGQVHGRTFLHGYTSSFALFREA